MKYESIWFEHSWCRNNQCKGISYKAQSSVQASPCSSHQLSWACIDFSPPLLFLENISALYFSQAKMHSLSLPLIRIAVSLSTWISPAVFDIFCYTMLELPKVSSEFSLTFKGQTTICMSRDQPYCLTLKKMYKIDAFYSEVLEIWYLSANL